MNLAVLIIGALFLGLGLFTSGCLILYRAYKYSLGPVILLVIGGILLLSGIKGL